MQNKQNIIAILADKKSTINFYSTIEEWKSVEIINNAAKGSPDIRQLIDSGKIIKLNTLTAEEQQLIYSLFLENKSLIQDENFLDIGFELLKIDSPLYYLFIKNKNKKNE